MDEGLAVAIGGQGLPLHCSDTEEEGLRGL